MNSATWVKFLAGVLLFAAWLALVLMRIVPPGPLVDAIGYALIGLGVYHASANGASVSPLLASLLGRVGSLDPSAAGAATPGKLLRTTTYASSTPGSMVVSDKLAATGGTGGGSAVDAPPAPAPAPAPAPVAAATLQ
ncbi:hypothetical protein KBK24_0121845 [Burkholderia sp. K24]|nr:hypothetical protein KBK24_0121845 [Burkholderia sp. K24]